MSSFDPRSPEAREQFDRIWADRMRELLREEGIEEEKIEPFIEKLRADAKEWARKMNEERNPNAD